MKISKDNFIILFDALNTYIDELSTFKCNYVSIHTRPTIKQVCIDLDEQTFRTLVKDKWNSNVFASNDLNLCAWHNDIAWILELTRIARTDSISDYIIFTVESIAVELENYANFFEDAALWITITKEQVELDVFASSNKLKTEFFLQNFDITNYGYGIIDLVEYTYNDKKYKIKIHDLGAI